MKEEVRLIENFVSWQGEGPDSGQTMIILRFKTCNLKCPWCDTSVKMRISAEAPYKISDIQDTVNENRSGLLITGGEPTVPKHFDETVALLNQLDYPVANVESNGYQLKKLIQETDPAKNVHFMYSPKFFSPEDLENQTKVTLDLLPHQNLFIKVVYENKPLVIDYLEWLSSKITLEQANKVWLMPEGTTRVNLIKNSEEVFNACEKYKFNFSSRSHIIFGFV